MSGQDVVKLEKDLEKVVNSPEGPLEIPIGNGKKAQVYWIRAGFGHRIYYIAEAKKELREAEQLGLIFLTKIDREVPKGKIDKINQSFILKHTSVKEETLAISVRGKPQLKGKDYLYMGDGLLFFSTIPSHPPDVAYEYYDEEIYREITNNSANAMLIYLLARKIENHEEHYFKSPKHIKDSLTVMELAELLGIYFKKLGLRDDDLKNLSTASNGEEGKDSPKDTISIPSEQKSGV